MDIVLAIIFFLIGISVGSFLNVVADRVPMGKSIISPRSHCFQCGHNLEARDMVPVISYLLLKGKCRYCSTPIPARSMLVELFTGLVFATAVLLVGLNWQLAGALISISIFIILGIVDLESGILPRIILYPAILLMGLVAVINTYSCVQPEIQSAFWGFIMAAGLFFLLWGIFRIFKKNIVGFGDISMAGLVGMAVGFPLALIALYLSVLLGIIMVIVLIILSYRKLAGPIPFGLFLALGAIGTILWGKELLAIHAFIFAG